MKRKWIAVLCSVMLWVCSCGTATESNDTSKENQSVENESVNQEVNEESNDEAAQMLLSMKALSEAEETAKEDLEYEIFEGVVFVSGYNGDSVVLVVPDEIEGYPVVEITRTAFRNDENLKAVRIGNNVKYIRDEAFVNCENLEYVMFGESVEILEENAFVGCWSLKEVSLNEGLTTIGELAIPYGAEEPITIPKSVTTIEDGAIDNVKVYAGSYAEIRMAEFATMYDDFKYEVIE